MKKAYVFKSDYSDGRPNFYDLVVAETVREAETEALLVVRGIDSENFGADEKAEVDIVCELASSPGTLGEELFNIDVETA